MIGSGSEAEIRRLFEPIYNKKRDRPTENGPDTAGGRPRPIMGLAVVSSQRILA